MNETDNTPNTMHKTQMIIDPVAFLYRDGLLCLEGGLLPLQVVLIGETRLPVGSNTFEEKTQQEFGNWPMQGSKRE